MKRENALNAGDYVKCSEKVLRVILPDLNIGRATDATLGKTKGCVNHYCVPI